MRLPRKLLLVALALGLLFGLRPLSPVAPTPVQARSVDEITSEINSLTGEVNRLDGEISKLQAQLEQKRSEIRSLSNDISTLTTEIDEIGLQVQNTQLKIQRTQTEIEKTEIEIKTKEREIQKTKKVLAEYIRLINDSDNVNTFEILLSGKSFSDMLNQFEYTETLQKKTQESLELIKQLKSDLEQRQAELEQQRNEAISLQAQLEGQRDALAEKRAEKDRLLALSKDQEASYQDLLVQNEKQQQSVLKEIRSLETELGNQTGGIPAGAPPAGSGVLAPPNNGTITQDYGMTSYAQAGAYAGAGHNGLDFAAPLGSPVFASADGVVSGVGDLGGFAYGRWISVHHDELGFDTLYGHLLSQKVSVGQHVKRGQIIGLVGSTGYSSGPHTHFMVCFNLQTVQRSYGLLPYCNHVNPHLYL
ncbi:MAG: peptidoglycan DD-metalloendopeptidase family protein [Candidatus Andersenbacteria bacterium]